MALSPRGEAYFPNLFEPSRQTGKYDIMLRINPEELEGDDKDAWERMIGQAKAIAKDEFDKPLSKIKNPFQKGDPDDKYLDDPECYYVRFGTTSRPSVVGPNPKENLEPEEVYGGMLARVSYTMKSYDRNGNRGITVYLNNVQKTGQGERKGGQRVAAEDEFGTIEEDVATDLFS
jgi:hypothetical protein